MKNDDYDYRLKINLLCVIKNIIVLILFIILAIAFNKWWLIFIGALFFSEVKSDK